WNVSGPFVQVMDPGKGRGWTTWSRLESELFIHRFPVSAAAWREWAGSEGFLLPLRSRLRELDVPNQGEELIAEALKDETWRGLAVLDAAARMLSSIVAAQGLERGKQITDVLELLVERGGRDVPDIFWFVTPGESESPEQEIVMMRGVVLIRVWG